MLLRHPFLMTLMAFAAIFVGTCLYVPWKLTFQGGSTSTEYGLVFRRPSQGYLHDWSRVKIDAQSQQIDWSTLVDEWVVLGTCLACSYPIATRTAAKPRPTPTVP